MGSLATAFIAAVALVTTAATPAPNLRHTALRSSVPAKDAQLDSAPARITLWFTARIQLPFSRVSLSGPRGDVPVGAAVADTGNGFAVPIEAPLPAGTYTVRWQTAGADGHVIRGEYAFTLLRDDPALATQDAGPPPPPPAPPERTMDEELAHTPPRFRATRWIEFAALLTILGALAFRGIVLPAAASRGVVVADASDRALRLGRSAVALYALAAIVRLHGQSGLMSASGSGLDPGTLRVLLFDTTWGLGWTLGAAGALLVVVGWKLRRWHGLSVGMVIAGALGLVLAPALTGHAVAAERAALAVTLDAVHVVGAGMWIGGLLITAIAGVPAMLRFDGDARHEAVGSLVNSFHPLALLCAPLVVLSGFGSAWLRLGGTSTLLTTEYGSALLWKLLFVGLVILMGAWNSARMRRRLGTAEATRHARVTMGVELLFAALVVAATTVLVVTPLPTDLGVQ